MYYTVGTEERYTPLLDKGLTKLGKTHDYAGGFVFKRITDATDHIRKTNMQGIWAVFVLAETTEKDIYFDERGQVWRLVNDIQILECILTREQVKKYLGGE